MNIPFLKAEWRHLVMLNYEVPRELLEPWVPAGTALDTYKGDVYVSLVGFLFLNTRVKGISIPFHQNFEEVNLRFYVRRFNGQEWRRGVVFIREIVPKFAIASTARLLYNEPYIHLPMRHQVTTQDGGVQAQYEWKFNGRWNQIHACTKGSPALLRPGTLDEFITEHYWGYNRQRDGATMEYRVDHPSWQIWSVGECGLDCDIKGLYGEAFAAQLNDPPRSAFIAEGSEVTVHHGSRLE